MAVARIGLGKQRADQRSGGCRVVFNSLVEGGLVGASVLPCRPSTGRRGVSDGCPAANGAAAHPLLSLHVFEAIQFHSKKVGRINGNIPYSVSVAEWEWRSIAMNTWTQKARASATISMPYQKTGR